MTAVHRGCSCFNSPKFGVALDGSACSVHLTEMSGDDTEMGFGLYTEEDFKELSYQKPGTLHYSPTEELPTPKFVSDIYSPPHYTQGKIEVITFIEDQKFEYHESNVIKYVSRARWKGKELSDLKKARWYLDRKIKLLEEKETEPCQTTKKFNRS